MTKIYNDSEIYVVCPAKIITGGTELAHQLVDCLINLGYSAYIVYVDTVKFVLAEIPHSFQKYKIKKTDKPIDSQKNILVLPESRFNFGIGYENIQMMFWWMSVDNFFLHSTLLEQLRFFGFYNTMRNAYGNYLRDLELFGKISLRSLKRIKNKNIHLYQSQYAKEFLISKRITQLMPLSDYINPDFINKSLTELSQKEDIILYNPKKGFKTTKKIIEQLPSYNFVPLIDLDRDELHNYLKRAKLYIDFGNHPGKDRLPREAALNNCCIITGRRGSANYRNDIEIPDNYKFNDFEINKIILGIKGVLENYHTHISSFSNYKQKILNEKKVFIKEVESIFGMK